MAFKQTKRKGFNFFRSYYDVYNELEKDSDKIAFIEALLDRQFLGVEPTELKGMARFAWISQVNSIDGQVKGFEDKTGLILTPTEGGRQAPTEGGKSTPALQEKEKGKEKEKDIPSVSEFIDYCKSKQPNIDESHAKLKFEQWVENGWKDGYNKPIKMWKSKANGVIPHLKTIEVKAEPKYKLDRSTSHHF